MPKHGYATLKVGNVPVAIAKKLEKLADTSKINIEDVILIFLSKRCEAPCARETVRPTQGAT